MAAKRKDPNKLVRGGKQVQPLGREKLTPHQSRAIDAYFENGGKQRDAMRAAGYAESTATNFQVSVFQHPAVVAEIARRRKKLAKKHELTQDWIIERYMQLADAGKTLAKFKKVQEDGTLMWDFTEATEEDLALVSELGVDFYTEGRGPGAIDVKKFKIKTPDVQAALTALSRHLGLFNDSLEVKGDLAARIQAGRARAFAVEEDEGVEEETVH